MKKKLVKVLAMLMAVATVGCTAACGGDDDPPLKDGQVRLEIDVFNGGYDVVWLDELAKAYMAKHDNVIIKWADSIDRANEQAIQITSGRAKADLYFTGFNIHEALYSKVTLADLSDVYDEVGDKLIPSVKAWYEHDGKQYSIPWATAPLGIVYNGAYFEQKNLDVPRTTNELFDVAETITANRTKTSDPYAFIYASGKESDCYLDYLMKPWMAQYEGIANYEKYMDVKLKDGTQYDEAWASEYYGVLRTLEVYQELLLDTNGFNVPYPTTGAFSLKQQQFLEGRAVMIFNGDWIVSEILKGNYTEEQTKDLAFMRTPIISSIVETMPMWTANGDAGKHYSVDPKPSSTINPDDPTCSGAVAIDDNKKAAYEQALCAIIDFVDGVTTVAPTSVAGITISQADIARIQEARSITPSMSCYHNAVIPSNSKEIDEAKDFLKFMYSDEGLEVYAQHTYACGLPVQYTDEKIAEIAGDSKLIQSAYAMLDDAYLTFHTGSKNKAFCKNGLSIVYHKDKVLFYKAFAAAPNTKTYKSAWTFFKESRSAIENAWGNITSGLV